MVKLSTFHSANKLETRNARKPKLKIQFQNFVMASPLDASYKDSRGQTALHIAAKQGDVEAVQLFLADKRVDANHSDKTGFTALMHAAGEGHEKVTELLLADERVDVNQVDKYVKVRIKERTQLR